jgi:DNA-binding CsgD family transcriptional regulator
MLKRALSAFHDEDISTEDEIRWLWLACHTAALLWEDEIWHELSVRHVQRARDAGALNVLPIALSSRIGVLLQAGEVAAAASLIEELDAVADETGFRLARYGTLWLAVGKGDEAEVSDLIEESTELEVPPADGAGLTIVHFASAVLYNGLGRYEEALAAAQCASASPDPNPALLELIEAASRTGRPECAADALDRLSHATRASGTDWGLGTEARARALLAEGQAAEALYREAIERLGRSRAAASLARAHLTYGEWLRRERRQLDAREQLRTAHDMFAAMGLDLFAQRAARELLATGTNPRKRSVETRGQLTAQEAQVARLAREGFTNPEIGSQLFISPRTVEYHLHKVFAKLDISSRHQLDRVLSGDTATLQAA